MKTNKNTLKAKAVNKESKPKKQSQFYVNKELTPQCKALLLGEYFHLHDRMIHPVTNRWIERMCKLMMEWVRKDTSLRITDFTDSPEVGLDPFSYYDFVNRFAEMKITHDYCMRRIASRREIGGLTNKYNTSMISRVQSHYDSTWALQEEKIARMAKDINTNSASNMKVVINEFERLEGEDAPTYVDVNPHQAQADAYHAKRSEFAQQEQALLEEKTLVMLTPEEVAIGITKQGIDARWEGKGQYVAKQNIKKRIKDVEGRVYE